jgi:leucyl-tRNA synthetase
MDAKYDPQAVESAAQAHWQRTHAYRAVEHANDAAGRPKPKFYVCSMLPYRAAACTWVMCATTR